MSIDVPVQALPSRKLRLTILYLAATIATLSILFACLGMAPSRFVVDFRFVADLAQQMFPPNCALYWTKSTIFVSLVQTLSMAFLATFVGGSLALFLAFFAAVNTTPHPLVKFLVRSLMVLNRSVPSLIVILVLLIAVGIGPFAGTLALIFGSVGMYGKFFADAIEHCDKGTLESVESLGGTRLQTIRFAVLPQVMPSFVANLFYAFDYNLRAAIPLGVFGGGGIGYEVALANGLLRYKDMLAYTILIIIMIHATEHLSDWVRRRIISQPQFAARP
jgi:phosphonate transport system permease protein